MRLNSVRAGTLAVALAAFASASPPAAAEDGALPGWLAAHVGTGPRQIAAPVLQRSRALYRRAVADGRVRNPCYFAMDATRPNELTDSATGGRFYVICEAKRSFEVVSAGHGGGRTLYGVDFSNGRECARNFGNALDSKLTAGGAYVTADEKSSFKGYYREPGRPDAMLRRDFIQFDGQDETANARQRQIGGHAAVLLAGVCMRKQPGDPHADANGLVPFGRLVDYAAGRSDGCTSWSRPDADKLAAMIRHDPTTLYIYPESKDIQAVRAGLAAKAATPYWNAECLASIGTPRFWSQDDLGAVLARFRLDHPPQPDRPPPMCVKP